MDLSSLKREAPLLLAVLGQQREGKHLHCPFHEDRNGSLHVGRGDDGVMLWKCWAGCGSGTIIDAAMRKWGTPTARGAVQALEREMGVRLERDEEYVEPRIDQERAEKLVAFAHKRLMDDFGLQDKYLVGKRGIYNLDEVRRYRLGFIVNTRLPKWHTPITGWVLPITDADDRLVAVKIHTEMVRNLHTKNVPKCFWVALGTYPDKEPKNGTYTLWPPPERWERADRLYLCPGELKALATVGAGQAATGLTSGESGKLPKRLVSRLLMCEPGVVMVQFDDDAPGRKWRDLMLDSLRGTGVNAKPLPMNMHVPPAPPPAPPPPPPEDPAPNSPEDLGFVQPKPDLDAAWSKALANKPPAGELVTDEEGFTQHATEEEKRFFRSYHQERP